MPGGAALAGPTGSAATGWTVGRIRRSRHPARRQVPALLLTARRRCACRAYGFCGHRLDRRPDKAQPPSGIKTSTRSAVDRPAALRLPGLRVLRPPVGP
ncbi:hypothetical protein DMQ35_17840 [Klebsiella quasipneumoniae]|nr:hypothetical protein DMQ35_17840 [Klebsiella quasipneumoniae]